jgi:hypothetical protein
VFLLAFCRDRATVHSPSTQRLKFAGIPPADRVTAASGSSLLPSSAGQ